MGRAAILVLGVLAVLPACSSDEEKAPTLSCTGTSCTCAAGTACDLGGTSCEQQSCSIGCKDSNVCTGSCGQSCSVDCGGASTCSLTVGPSSSVTCAAGTTCHIVCGSSCSLSCAGSCDLKCAQDSAPRTVTGTGACQAP